MLKLGFSVYCGREGSRVNSVCCTDSCLSIDYLSKPFGEPVEVMGKLDH